MKTTTICSLALAALLGATSIQVARADAGGSGDAEVPQGRRQTEGQVRPLHVWAATGLHRHRPARTATRWPCARPIKANHFKDQNGHKVVRTQSGGNSQSFKWENGKHVNVTLITRPSYHQGGHNKHDGYNQGNYSNQQTYAQDGVGSEHPWATEGGTHHSKAVPLPEIIMGTNGEGEVIFKNNCVVYFDKRGRRTSNLPACSSEQVSRAAGRDGRIPSRARHELTRIRPGLDDDDDPPQSIPPNPRITA
ncbi:MAG: hypothetical protein MZV49_13030 [Rhodopseudomonas palustris]|nr:hypothetical protein [Rhodopseudomonas palustris]